MKRVLIGFGCVLIGLGVAFYAVVAMALGNGWSGFSWKMPFSANNAKLVNSTQFAAGDLDEIDLRYVSDSVILMRSGSDDVVFEEYSSSNNSSKYLANVSQQGRRLNIEEGGMRNAVGINLTHSYAKLYLPDSWQGKLNLSGGSGSIKAENALNVAQLTVANKSGSIKLHDVTSSGDVSLDCGSGSVQTRSITSGGSVRLNASSGSVKPGDVTAQALDVESGSGSIHLGHINSPSIRASTASGSLHAEVLNGAFDLHAGSGSVHVERGEGEGRADSGSGTVKLTLDALTGDLKLNSGSGSVRLWLPKDTSMAFRASTGSGSIRTPFDDALSFNERKTEATGNYGSTPAPQVDCSTTSGSVKLEWA